jgi:hypothetical protein
MVLGTVDYIAPDLACPEGGRNWTALGQIDDFQGYVPSGSRDSQAQARPGRGPRRGPCGEELRQEEPGGLTMTHSFRGLVCGLALAALAVTMSCGCGFRGARVPVEETDSSASEAQRTGRLLAERADVYERWAAIRRVEEGLFTGRITLLEAARQFRDVHRSLPNPEPATRCLEELFPGKSDGEKYCRLVIAHIRGCRASSELTAPIAARLERELNVLLRRGGIIRLPEES